MVRRLRLEAGLAGCVTCVGRFQSLNPPPLNISALVSAVFKLLDYVRGVNTSAAACISRVFLLPVSIVNRQTTAED